MKELEEMMAERLRLRFPDCMETGKDYGEVNSVLVSADIYGWALRTSRAKLEPDDEAALLVYRDRLARSIKDFPEQAKGYYEFVLKLETATFEQET